MEKAARVYKIEFVVAVVLGILTVGVFYLQIILLDSDTSQLEATLFNVLQFILSVGFSWYSARAVSKLEFEDNIRKFAISAYRRITDIRQILSRLQDKIDRPGIDEKSESSTFELINAVVFDTALVVESSIADWADIIGKDLAALEKINKLEREKFFVEGEGSEENDSIPSEAEIGKIDKEIAHIKSNLPGALKIEVERSGQSIVKNRHSLGSLKGSTFRVETPLGRAFVTINEDENDSPVEVFATVSKAGSEANAVSEALGRLTTCVLTLSESTPLDRLRLVRNELLGLGGDRQSGFGPHRVRSLPDGIAVAFSQYLDSRTDSSGSKPI